MEARNLPDALNLIMEQRGCSGSQLARDVGVSQSWLSDASRGKKDTPTAKAIRLLASVGWEMVIRPKREEEDPVKRREFMAAAASVTFVPSPKASPYQDSAYVRELATRLRHDLFEHGGVSLVSTATRHAQNVQSALVKHVTRDRELQVAASDLTYWITAVLCDARLFNVAENAGGLTLRLARGAGDMDAQARAYIALTEVNVDRGKADRAVKYAQEGVALPEIFNTQRAWLNVFLAEAFALVRGQEQSACSALERTQGYLEESLRFGSLPARDAGDMAGEVGIALTSLRMYEKAHESLDNAVRLTGQSSPFLQGCYLGRQIETALRASQPSIAADRMLRLARVVPLVSSTRIDGHVTQILGASARWADMPDMRDARDQLRSVAPSIPNKRGSQVP
jgi:transcriptional regulator with XRE-family HTH domain